MVDVGRLTLEDRGIVADYWWSRARGEMTSWVGFGHVLADLVAEGAPSPMIALAERSVLDERRHALFCRDWALRFGHEPGDVLPRSETPIVFPDATDAENRLLRIAFCAFTETVGSFVLRHARVVITDPELRALNRRHSADELQHGRVGWAYLAGLGDPARSCLESRLDELLALLRRTSCDGTELSREDLVPFGYFTPRLLRDAHADALSEVILPGLSHLGIRRAA